MEEDIRPVFKSLFIPKKDSHKGQNGRLLVIGGSHLFHSASLWALSVASRIVDLVHYSSVEDNNRIVQKLKEEFRDGIVVPRSEIENYILEDDCILIGPGMMRSEASISNFKFQISNLQDIKRIPDEGMQTYYLTKYLLKKYPHKKWVIDAGALQMLEPAWIPPNAILTPHHREFERLFSRHSGLDPESTPLALDSRFRGNDKDSLESRVRQIAKKYNCVVLLKGEVDYVASKNQLREIKGGNAGMTKGGTGDVLAGLAAALFCKHDAFTAAVAGSYINKKAGDDLFKTMGYWFNASDLADQIPKTMKRTLMSAKV